MSFELDLTTLYYIATEKRLRPDILKQFITVYSKMFARTTRRPTTKEHKLFLRCCVDGLLAFTQHITEHALEQPPITAPFKTQHSLRSIVFAPDPKGSEYRPEHITRGNYEAYEALVKPFKTHSNDLGFLNQSKDNFWWHLDRYPSRDYDDTPEGRRSKREAEKDREKWFQDWMDMQSSMQLMCCSTPFYSFAREIELNTIFELPFDIPEDRWFEGCWIVAPQGSGKTNLLRHLILHRLKDDATIIIMDAKGNLLDSFERLAEIKDRLVVLKLTKDQPLAINPLASNSIETLEYLFGVFNAELSSMQQLLFRMILLLLQKIPNATLEDFWRIIAYGWRGKYDEYVMALPERTRLFFEKDFMTAPYRQRCLELDWRLRKIIDHPVLGPTFTSKTNKIDMASLLDSGNVICLDNNYDRLGPEASEFIGRLFLALIWQAGRAKARTKPVYVFIDEAHCTIKNDPQVNDMITQLRSPKISLTFAHQGLFQIDNEKVRSALSLCAIKFCSASGEAAEMARYMEIEPEVLKSYETGQIACWVKGLTKTRAETLSVKELYVHKEGQTFKDTATYPLMDDNEYAAFRRTMAYKYGQIEAPPTQDQPTSPADDTIYERNEINPTLADKGGIYKAKVRLDVHGRKFKTLNITIPPNMREGFRLKLNGYGVFRPDGTRGAIIHILHRRKSDAPSAGPAEIGADWD